MEIQRSPVIIAGQPAVYAKGSAVTGAKGFVLLSGSVGIDVDTGTIPEGAGEQAKLAMENIKARLEEYGSSLKNILLVRKYIKGGFPDGIVNDPVYGEIGGAIERFWADHCPEFLKENNPPASTLLGVTSLATPEYLLEIEVVAAVE
ncbi:MAG: RidA family protein [Deltaproteobacteria bacterium]|nr:RidA family protein [Deltaproteobacteria bacterium]